MDNIIIDQGISLKQATRYIRMMHQTFYLLDWSTIEHENIDANIHFVISGSSHNLYTVKLHDNQRLTCDCPDAQSNEHDVCMCKHCCFILAKVGKVLDANVYRTGILTDDAVQNIEGAVRHLAAFVQPSPIPKPQSESCDLSIFAPEGSRNIGGDCNICMELLDPNDMGNLVKCHDCNIAFHHACIQRWLERDVKCPTCRSVSWTGFIAPIEDRYQNIAGEQALLNRGHCITTIISNM